MAKRPLTDQHADFVELARTLRRMGAVRVRCGSMEVAFDPPPPPKPAEVVDMTEPVSLAEADYLDDLRRRAEEMP